MQLQMHVPMQMHLRCQVAKMTLDSPDPAEALPHAKSESKVLINA